MSSGLVRTWTLHGGVARPRGGDYRLTLFV